MSFPAIVSTELLLSSLGALLVYKDLTISSVSSIMDLGNSNDTLAFRINYNWYFDPRCL